MAGFNFDLWLIKLLWTPAIKWPFYTVSIGSKFSLQRKHALVLEESLMSSTMDMRTIVNELKFSLQINIFSHIARGCKKKYFTQSAWVYAWLKPFQTALSFRDSEWYIKMKNCACDIILKKNYTLRHCIHALEVKNFVNTIRAVFDVVLKSWNRANWKNRVRLYTWNLKKIENWVWFSIHSKKTLHTLRHCIHARGVKIFVNSKTVPFCSLQVIPQALKPG